MSQPTGPGKTTVLGKSPREISRESNLYNFDIDSPGLKAEHKQWLDSDVVPLLKASPKATVSLRGNASRSGEKDHNRALSRGRAEEVKKYLVSKGVDPKQVVKTEGAGSDQPMSALGREVDIDRGVVISTSAPLTIEKVSLWNDHWTRELEWDDIIGLDEGKTNIRIDNVNIQIEASGAPRSFMPETLEIQLTSRVPNRDNGGGQTTIKAPSTWNIPLSEKEQAKDPSRTWYRLSAPVATVGKFLDVEVGKVPEVALVVREGGTSDKKFRDALGWSFRGRGVQSDHPNGSERDESPDAKRLILSGGLEVLEAKVVDRPGWEMKRPSAARLVRSPADVLYYSGHGLSKEGCLAIHCDCDTRSVTGYDCWCTPEDLLKYWKKPLDLDVLIIAGCSVLRIDYFSLPPRPTGGPGLRWAKLLKANGGPLEVILGYNDEALSDDHGADDIAAQMGKKIKAGLQPNQWVYTWLQINAHNHPQSRPAVGMDRKGYWRLEFSLTDTIRRKDVRSHHIAGPFPIS
jgi:hypothetical protein